jgi:hypothetical protein
MLLFETKLGLKHLKMIGEKQILGKLDGNIF